MHEVVRAACLNRASRSSRVSWVCADAGADVVVDNLNVDFRRPGATDK
jgi:hypothetical protein